MHGIVRKGLSVVLAMLMVIPSSFVVFADDTEDIAAEKQCGSSSQDAADYASENTSSENTEAEAPESTPVQETIESTAAQESTPVQETIESMAAPESTPVQETIESTAVQEERVQSGSISAETSTEVIRETIGAETGIDGPTDENQTGTEHEEATLESSEETSEPAAIVLPYHPRRRHLPQYREC